MAEPTTGGTEDLLAVAWKCGLDAVISSQRAKTAVIWRKMPNVDGMEELVSLVACASLSPGPSYCVITTCAASTYFGSIVGSSFVSWAQKNALLDAEYLDRASLYLCNSSRFLCLLQVACGIGCPWVYARAIQARALLCLLCTEGHFTMQLPYLSSEPAPTVPQTALYVLRNAGPFNSP